MKTKNNTNCNIKCVDCKFYSLRENGVYIDDSVTNSKHVCTYTVRLVENPINRQFNEVGLKDALNYRTRHFLLDAFSNKCGPEAKHFKPI